MSEETLTGDSAVEFRDQRVSIPGRSLLAAAALHPLQCAVGDAPLNGGALPIAAEASQGAAVFRANRHHQERAEGEKFARQLK